MRLDDIFTCVLTPWIFLSDASFQYFLHFNRKCNGLSCVLATIFLLILFLNSLIGVQCSILAAMFVYTSITFVLSVFSVITTDICVHCLMYYYSVCMYSLLLYQSLRFTSGNSLFDFRGYFLPWQSAVMKLPLLLTQCKTRTINFYKMII